MSEAEFEYLGPYRVERTLGRGGMGTVYKGIHSKSGDAVAIKVIATGVANQSRFRRRFATEVETLKRLKHPHIVQLVGFGEEQGLLFYSMEYVEGHSLHDHLRQHQNLPWEDVIQVGIETTGALKHAHDLGIIHRDLKPANLMLNTQGHIKLTDFGIAKLFGSSDMTAAGSVIGTADYMPPEQAEGKGVTVRSDLYSLGGVLYALLVGKAPFGGKSVPEVLYSVRYNPAPDLAERVPDAPKELVELIHQLLEKDPQKRPPTALVVGNRLKSLQQGMRRSSGTGIGRSRSSESAINPEKIGTHMTSLDLSDVDDNELKLTGEEPAKIGSGGDVDTHESAADPPGTHEQQTMLAPEGWTDRNAGRDEPTSLAEQGLRRQDDFSHAEPNEPEAMSIEEPLSSGGPSHYTPITEKDTETYTFSSPAPEQEAQIDWLHYGSMAGIVALLLGCVGFGWWMLRPRSANDIYAEVIVAVQSGDDGQLLAARGLIDEFLTRFPDDERHEELQDHAHEAELTRRTRLLQRRASRQGGVNELSAIEQAFLDCMQQRTQDVGLGQEKLLAFLTVFGSLENLPSSERHLVELAQFAFRADADSKPKPVPAAALQLEKLIQSAEKSLSTARLKGYYQNLLLLYGDKPWAEEQMNRVRKKLSPES